ILEETEVGKKRYLRVKVTQTQTTTQTTTTTTTIPSPPASTPEQPAQWVLASDVNEVRPRAAPEGVNPVGRWIDVDVGEQVLVAYEGERPVYATLTATGASVPTPL